MTTSRRPPPPAPRLLRILRDPVAAPCLVATVLSGFGSSALWLVSGIWVKDLTGSNTLAALALLAMWTPTLAGPVLGTLADRLPRKPLLIHTNLTLAALLLTLFAVDAPGDVWLLFTVLVLYRTAGVVQDAAEAALMARGIDKTLLGDFNGLRMTANEGMKLLAPLAGAGLYAAYGGPSVALLDALTFVLAALAYARVRTEPAAETGATAQSRPGDWRTRTTEGVSYLRHHPTLRPVILAAGATMFLTGAGSALLYAVIESLGHSPTYAGPLYVLQGLGSVTVGLASGPLLRRLGERRFAAYGIALTGVATALRAVPSDAVFLTSGVAMGVGLPCALIAGLTAVQRETPNELLGRTAATANTLMFAPTALGLAVGAALVSRVDHRTLLPVLGLGLCLTAGSLRRRGSGGTVPGCGPGGG
ncbi:MFS transporter [Streptomyces geranii]|uniref:MFS transporter n=1 Tax=Streptomyces geranii TaxID=2058923 RepID=UPI000D02D98A|nr:MFS transporter [Streptomyces geranii]